jgi:hypothetical protein
MDMAAPPGTPDSTSQAKASAKELLAEEYPRNKSLQQKCLLNCKSNLKWFIRTDLQK